MGYFLPYSGLADPPILLCKLFLVRAFWGFQTLAFHSGPGPPSLLFFFFFFIREVSGRLTVGSNPQNTVKDGLVCFGEMMNGGLNERRNRADSYCNLASCYYWVRYNADWLSPLKINLLYKSKVAGNRISPIHIWMHSRSFFTHQHYQGGLPHVENQSWVQVI